MRNDSYYPCYHQIFRVWYVISVLCFVFVIHSSIMDVAECEINELKNVILPFHQPRTTKKYHQEVNLKSERNGTWHEWHEKPSSEVKYILLNS